MKLYKRRTLSQFIILILTLSMIFGTCLNVSAADETTSGYQPKDPYVLKFGNGSGTSWSYAQFSPFVPTLNYDNVSIDGYSIIFGLYNAATQQSFEALYCTDLPVDANDSRPANYRRINLSDSTYAAKLANSLRAVLLNTYPHISVEALSSASGISGLTRGEAITGSQLAIWKLAHGDNVQVTDFLKFTTTGNSASSTIQNELRAELNAYNEGDDTYRATVKNHIESLYHYLLNLKPVAPTKKVVSESSFVSKDTQPTRKDNGDGTYDITVHTTVNVQISSGDHLTLTAHMDGGAYYVSTPLTNGQNAYTLTIKNVPASAANGSVTLAIDGTQSGSDSDVYLIDAEGIRGTSQSMIGVVSDTLPVHAETKAEPDRVLNIYKTGGGTPLSNISFDVYYVGSVDDYLSGKLGIGSKPTDSDIAKYAQSTNLVGTLTTDENGTASLNFGTVDGVYMVKELPNSAVKAPAAPFFVCLPDYSRCDPDDGTPSYTITAKPKNEVNDEDVDISKDVTKLDQKSDSYAVGENHTWIIRTSIPVSIASGKSYVITDTLDYRLDYQQLDKVVLSKEPAQDDEDWTVALTLTAGTDYLLTTEQRTDTEGHNVDYFSLSLTSAGMLKIAQTVDKANAQYELHTYFTAQINENASMGVEIPNQADIHYTNNIGKSFSDMSDQPEVHTGGIRLLKVDATTKAKLAGATFSVYRMATADEIAADKTENKLPTFKIGNVDYKMVQATFYATPDLTGDKVDSLTTNEDGLGYIYGLAYGDYYLVETKAPDGYNKLLQPEKFTINAVSHQEDSGITVSNSTGAELPSTGGMGTTPITLLALTLIGFSSIALLYKHKKEV